jgi:hypothetical protein
LGGGGGSDSSSTNAVQGCRCCREPPKQQKNYCI